MFDLDAHVRTWRDEAEATLAFSADELDELEDHLRLTHDAEMKLGKSSAAAWDHAQQNLGPASALALEFAKDKLLPALWRLTKAWAKLILLAVVCGASASATFPVMFTRLTTGFDHLGITVITFQLFGAFSLLFALLLILLPDRASKNILILGAGISICLQIPLYALFYNRVTDLIFGDFWSHLVAPIPWYSVLLSLAGIPVFSLFWKRCQLWREAAYPYYLTALVTLIFILGLGPFLGDLIIALTSRVVFSLPDASLAPHDLQALTFYNTHYFVGNLILVVYQASWLFPLLSLLLIYPAFLLIYRATKQPVVISPTVFPSQRDIPWLITIGACGFWWIWGHSAEPGLTYNILRCLQQAPGLPLMLPYGVELTVLLCGFIYFITNYEITKRLWSAHCFRPIYTVAFIIANVILLYLPYQTIFNDAQDPKYQIISLEPAWFTTLFRGAEISLIIAQVVLFLWKWHYGKISVSLWKIESSSLLMLGTIGGLILAAASFLLWGIALCLAENSVMAISASLSWGQANENPLKYHYNPWDTPFKDYSHLYTSALFGPCFLAASLAISYVGLIVLSGLEFLRFNIYRIYKIGKLRRAVAAQAEKVSTAIASKIS